MHSKGVVDDYVRVPLPNGIDDNNDFEQDSEEYPVPQSKHKAGSSTTAHNPWNFEFYQQFFDVTTSQVLRRLAFALIPNPRARFMQQILKPQADLYGPFWIATTLILVTSISGNMKSYLQSTEETLSWQYDFKKVTLASAIIYTYWWFTPLGVMAFLYMRSKQTRRVPQNDDRDALLDDYLPTEATQTRVETNYQFTDFLAVYGYALCVFVPVSILWVIPSSILQWMLVTLAMVGSSAFLIFTLLPILRKEHPKLAVPVMVALVALHCLFAIGLMVTFHGSASAMVDNPKTVVEAAQLPSVKVPIPKSKGSLVIDKTNRKEPNKSAEKG